MNPSRGSVAVLTHFGRTSGRAYRVKVWWVELDGDLWVGSLDKTRGWVRNVLATRRAEIDRGMGAEPVVCEPAAGTADIARFRAAVKRKYPIRSRMLALFFEKESCAFRLRAAPPQSHA